MMGEEEGKATALHIMERWGKCPPVGLDLIRSLMSLKRLLAVVLCA